MTDGANGFDAHRLDRDGPVQRLGQPLLELRFHDRRDDEEAEQREQREKAEDPPGDLPGARGPGEPGDLRRGGGDGEAASDGDGESGGERKE